MRLGVSSQKTDLKDRGMPIRTWTGINTEQTQLSSLFSGPVSYPDRPSACQSHLWASTNSTKFDPNSF